MIAGLFATAKGFVDAGCQQTVGEFGRQQRVINAKPVIARPGTSLVIPIRPNPAARVVRGQRIGPPCPQQPAIGFARLRLHQRIISHCSRVPDITIGGNYIVIADHHGGHFFGRNRRHARRQPFHPAQFVIEFRAWLRIAIGQIDACHANTKHVCFQIARLFVLGFARQAALDFDWRFAPRQDRHPVKAFLPLPYRLIPDGGQIGGGKALVLRFDFLQTGHVGPGFFQPFDQARQPRLDTVDIERSDRDRPRAAVAHTLKLAPQPQPEAACGFSTRNAAPPSDST